jgi:hypothetical protein
METGMRESTPEALHGNRYERKYTEKYVRFLGSTRLEELAATNLTPTKSRNTEQRSQQKQHPIA